MALYHIDLGFPAGSNLPVGGYEIHYTRHALTEAHNDKYGQFVLPEFVVLDGSETFELEVVGGSSVKAVVRVRYDERMDLCLVLVPGSAPGHAVCKTVWLNERTDTHKTIKYGRYTRP